MFNLIIVIKARKANKTHFANDLMRILIEEFFLHFKIYIIIVKRSIKLKTKVKRRKRNKRKREFHRAQLTEE